MSTKPITNDTANPMYVGSRCIPPGETRVFSVDELPPHLRDAPRPKPAPEPEPDPRLEVLELSVANITRHLGERDAYGAPFAADEYLDFFRDAEAAGKNRRGVLEALERERLARAAAHEDLIGLLEKDVEAFAAEVAARDDDGVEVLTTWQLNQLVEAAIASDTHGDYIGLLAGELARRRDVDESGDSTPEPGAD